MISYICSGKGVLGRTFPLQFRMHWGRERIAETAGFFSCRETSMGNISNLLRTLVRCGAFVVIVVHVK